jgi:ABC-type phosphate/phosphonate transport system substrate-binding protein
MSKSGRGHRRRSRFSIVEASGRLFFILIMLCVVSDAAIGSQAGAKSDLVLAYSAKNIPDLDPKDAAAAFNTYAKELARSMGLTVSSYVYENPDKLIEDVKKGSVDMLSLGVLEYLRVREHVGLELGMGGVRGGKTTTKYLLLVHANKGFEKTADLKGKKLVALKGDDLGSLYLTTTLLKQNLGDSRSFFSQTEEKPKPSQVVLAVFFGQADACLISDVSYKTMVEMNPQLGRDMKALAVSQELLSGVGAFRKGLSADIRQRVTDVAQILRKQARGRQVFLLFKIDDLTTLRESDLSSAKDLLAEYDRLSQRR